MLDLRTLRVGDKFIAKPDVYTVTKWNGVEGTAHTEFECANEKGIPNTFIACVMSEGDWQPWVPPLKMEEW